MVKSLRSRNNNTLVVERVFVTLLLFFFPQVHGAVCASVMGYGLKCQKSFDFLLFFYFFHLFHRRSWRWRKNFQFAWRHGTNKLAHTNYIWRTTDHTQSFFLSLSLFLLRYVTLFDLQNQQFTKKTRTLSFWGAFETMRNPVVFLSSLKSKRERYTRTRPSETHVYTVYIHTCIYCTSKRISLDSVYCMVTKQK